MYAQFYIFRGGSVCSIKVVAPKVIFFPPRRSPVPVWDIFINIMLQLY